MASHARTRFARLLHGSVAECVRLRANAPVLTVRLDTVRPDPCARILCAVDLSTGSEAAIAAALALADEHHAALRLLHVIDRPSAEDILAIGLPLPPHLRRHPPRRGARAAVRAAAEGGARLATGLRERGDGIARGDDSRRRARVGCGT